MGTNTYVDSILYYQNAITEENHFQIGRRRQEIEFGGYHKEIVRVRKESGICIFL